MNPGRALLLPFNSCYSLYGYYLAGIVLLAILQEYIYRYAYYVVVIMSVHVVKQEITGPWGYLPYSSTFIHSYSVVIMSQEFLIHWTMGLITIQEYIYTYCVVVIMSVLVFKVVFIRNC